MTPVPTDLPHLAAAAAAAFVASAVNSVAGGGTLISFPVLVAIGLPSIQANATSTAGIWPGGLGSIWGFRRELGRADRRMVWLSLTFVAGGTVGALLLRATSAHTFDRVVPFLILFATVLFAARGAVQAWLQRRAGTATPEVHLRWGVPATLAVGVYGGYFGAGMSIMNLSMLALLGLTDLLEMNALTSLYSLVCNAVAIAIFSASGLIEWRYAAAMAGGAVLGGYGATGLARKMGRKWLGRFVVAVGLAVSAVFFVRRILA